MALDYANHLKDELERYNLSVPVLIGGILNQKIEDEALPVDVTNNLKQLGFHPHQRLGQGFLKMFKPIDQNNLETNK